MQGKQDMSMYPTPLFYNDGRVSTRYVYKPQICSFSGWVLRRGDHKSPLPHKYTSLKAFGAGDYRELSAANPRNNAFTRVGSSKPYGFPTDVPDWLYNEALDSLYGKIRGNLDLSVDAFQGRQIARGFKAGDLVKQFRRDLRRNPTIWPFMRRADAIAKLAGSLRLAWVYGWKPLIMDYYSVLDESLRDYINKFQTFAATRTQTTSSMCVGEVVNTVNNLAPYRCLTKNSVRVSVTLDTTKMPSLAHWTSLNPASIGWELLPFSFVFDWFADVGSTLRSLESALLYNKSFKDGYVTKFARTTGESLGGTFTSYGTTFTARGHFAFTYVKVDRIVLSGMPYPDRHILRPRLGTDRLLNGLALLVSLRIR